MTCGCKSRSAQQLLLGGTDTLPHKRHHNYPSSRNVGEDVWEGFTEQGVTAEMPEQTKAVKSPGQQCWNEEGLSTLQDWQQGCWQSVWGSLHMAGKAASCTFVKTVEKCCHQLSKAERRGKVDLEN